MSAATEPDRQKGARAALIAAGATFLPPALAAGALVAMAAIIATTPGALADLDPDTLPRARTALCVSLSAAALTLRHRSAPAALLLGIAGLLIASVDMIVKVLSAPLGVQAIAPSWAADWAGAQIPLTHGIAIWMGAVAIIVLVRWPGHPLALAFGRAVGWMGLALMLASQVLGADLAGPAGPTLRPLSLPIVLIAGLCLAILATAVMSRPTSAQLRVDHSLAWSVVGLVTLGWIGWQQMELAELQQRRFETAITRDAVISRLSVELSERGTSQQRLANRWAIYGVPTEEQWMSDARAVLADFPGIFAIAYVDVDRIVRWRVARDGINEGFVGRSLNGDDQRRAAFDAAAATNTPRATGSVTLLSGARGNVFITPVVYDSRLHGFVVSSITSEDLIGLLGLPGSDGFHISILDSGGRVAGDTPGPSEPEYDLRSQGTLALLGQDWDVEVWPTKAYLLQRHSKLPGTLLGVGLFCILLVGAALAQSRFTLLHRTQAEDLTRRLARTLATINDGFITTNRAWDVTYVNQRALDILGWPADAAKGYTISDLSPQFEGSEIQALLIRVMDKQETGRTTILRPNGRQWLEIAAHPMPEGIAMYLRDVTTERARDAQLRLLETAVSRQNDTLIITDVATSEWKPHILYVNDAFTRMTGYTRDEVIGRTLHFLQGPGTSRAELDRVREALLSRQPIRVELINYDKAGREYWVELDIASIADATGKLTHHVAVERDITERKRAEEASAIMDERFQQVVMATNDVIWDIDLATRSVWHNENGRALFVNESEGKDFTLDEWNELIHPDDRERVRVKADQALAGAAISLADDYRLRRRDGSYAEVVSRARIIRNAEGRPIRMVGALIDETERRDLERRLRTSQRLEAVGQLTGGIAHDFNNLLTVIMGNAELLSERLGDQPILRQMADITLRAASSGAELTERLLSFARRQPLVARDVDVNALMLGMTSLLARTLPERIRVDLSPSDSVWHVLADASQLENAILNLALNARDAMPQGGTISIGTANVTVSPQEAARSMDAQPGDYVEISISDTGSGMSPEVLSRALEPFFTTKEAGKGTGLGLSMVYGFIRQSGGFLRIDSQPGRGTRIGLMLPRTVEGAGQRATPANGINRFAGGQEHVLVAEDDPMVRENAANMLESLGYRVTLASSGAEGLTCLKTDPSVDLLFTDVVMPGEMGGRELAEAARELRPELRILFTSGYSDTMLNADGQIIPGIPLLGKPYHLRDLAVALRNAFDAA